MKSLTPELVAGAIDKAGLVPIPDPVAAKLAEYGNLLLKWNAHTNLTAITDPAVVLDRHIVECVAAAQEVPAGVRSLLDYGSGAGLPGIVIALCRPEIAVTLAESQSKKVAFLREALRTLGLAITVFSGRVGDMALGARFEAVTMRAVDKMEEALGDATARLTMYGWLMLFATAESGPRLLNRLVEINAIAKGQTISRTPLPTVGFLLSLQIDNVPRGTN